MFPQLCKFYVQELEVLSKIHKSQTYTLMQALAFINKMTLVNSDSSHLVSFYTHAYAGTINRKKSLPPQSAGFPFSSVDYLHTSNSFHLGKPVI